MKFKSVFLSLAVVATLGIAHPGHEHKHHSDGSECHCMDKKKTSSAFSEIMDAMHKDMSNTKFVQSGVVEQDYLENMIPHHQGAVDSSKAILKYTKNEKIKKIANNIIKDQEKEIADFKEILKNKTYKATDISKDDYEKYVHEQKDNMDDMMEEMMEVKDSKNLDKDFLIAMIEHHKGAVDSSKDVLKYTKDDKVIKIANDIIDSQKKEIREFKNLIKKMK